MADGVIHGEGDLDRFGTSVALSESGRIVVIGADRFDSSSSAPKTGFAEVYSSDGGGNWSMVGDRILAEQCETRTRFHAYFGRDVSVSNSGKVVAVGGRGIVCIFEWDTNEGGSGQE